MKTDKNKELLLEQLKKTPIVQVACGKANIGRATYYRWRNEDKEFAANADASLQEGLSLMNDLAESKLLTAVNEGNLTGIMFWLKNRHNAYKTRVEISSAQKESITLTPEQEQIIKKAIGLTQITDNKEHDSE